MKAGPAHESRPWIYLLLVFGLAIPFWIIGGGRLPLAINLPVSALTTFVPFVAAAILVYRQAGFAGVRGLLARAWDYKRIRQPLWYLPALLLAPLIYIVSFVVIRLAGLPLPDPIVLPLTSAPIYAAMFLVSDAGEELGWSGYALEPLQQRWGVPRASIFLGVVWALWHSVPFVQTGHPAAWVLWQCVKTVAMRIVIVWIYNRAGQSVVAANLYHTTDNLSWSLFPNSGSHYQPAVTGLLTGLVAVLALAGWILSASGRRPVGASRRPGPA